MRYQCLSEANRTWQLAKFEFSKIKMSGGQQQQKLSFKSSWMKRYDTFNLLKKSLNHATGSGLAPVHVS